MNEFVFMLYRSKEESTMPFDAIEAFVLSGHPMAGQIGEMLEADGYDLMDAEIEVEGREGRWDYYGKIVGGEAE